APATDPDDLHRLHHGRGPARALHRRGRRDAPGHGHRGVLRDDRRDLLRPVPDAGVLRRAAHLRGRPSAAFGGAARGPVDRSARRELRGVRMMPTGIRLPLLLAGALALAGCSLAPKYEVPEVATP